MDKTPDELAPGTRVITAPELSAIGLGRLGRCPNKPGEVDRKGERFYHVVHDDNTYAPYLRDELTPAPAQPDELAPGARVVTAPELGTAAPHSPYRCPNKPGVIGAITRSFFRVDHDDGTQALYMVDELRAAPTEVPDTFAPGDRVVTAPELEVCRYPAWGRSPNKPGVITKRATAHEGEVYRIMHDDTSDALYAADELRAAPAEALAPDGPATIPTEAGVYLYGDPSANKPGVAQLSVYETAPMHVWAVMGRASEISHELMTERVQRNGWVFSRLDKPWPPSQPNVDAPAGTRPLLDRVSAHIEHAIDQGAVGVHVITIGDEIEAQGFGDLQPVDLVYALERSKLEVLRPEREPACGYADE